MLPADGFFRPDDSALRPRAAETGAAENQRLTPKIDDGFIAWRDVSPSRSPYYFAGWFMRRSPMRMIGTFLILSAALGAGVSSASAQTTAAAASLVALAPGGNVPFLESDVLGVVPENAYGVILGGNILESKATLEKVMRKLNIPFDQGDDYAKFTQFLEGLRGWDSKSTHAWAFVPGDEADDVEFAVFIPVTNYKDFAGSLGAEDDAGGPTKFEAEDGPDGYMASKAGFAVLVEKQNEDVLTKVVAAKKGVSDVGPAVRAWVGKHQAAGLILPAGMAKIFDKMIEGLDEIKKQVGGAGNEAAMVANMFDVYADLIKGGRDEITIFAMGARLDETSGLDWAMQAMFRPDGKFAAASKEIASLPTQPLRGLPEGEYFVAGAGVVPQNWMKGLMDFSLGFSAKMPKNLGGYDLTPEEAKELSEATAKSMEGMKSFSMSMGLSGKTFFDRMFGILRVDDSAKFLANYEQNLKRVGEIAKKNPKSGYPGQTVARKQVGGRDTLVVTVDMSAMLKQMEEQQGGDATKMMRQIIFGGDKITGYLTAADGQTVVMTYHEESLAALADDVKQGKAGLADDAQIKAAAALLPPESHWVGYMNVGGYMELVKKFMAAALAANGGPNFFPPIPPFPDSPPIGFSAKVNPASLEGHIVVPMGLAEAVRDYVMQMQGVFGGGLR
jgi:hypothetical protein